MRTEDRNLLHEYYDEKLKVRFDALTSIGDLENYPVLDVGCGFGDLYGHLAAKGIKFETRCIARYL